MAQCRSRRATVAYAVVAVVLAVFTPLALTGCGGTVDGQAVSPLYDPFRVGGMPAEGGPSGIRDGAPAPTGTVQNTDNGDADRLVLLSMNDIEEFWQANYAPTLNGSFSPVRTRVSYDSNDRSSPKICGTKTYGMVNAFYCPPKDLMAWDRGELVPVGEKFFGPMSITALIAHEYGHAVQNMAETVDDNTSTMVREQQADCFAGVYERWVAEGNSPRFTLDTSDGLNHLLAAVISIRDPIVTAEDADILEEQEHGTALDRVSAFQLGFTSGAAVCAVIDTAEVEERRAGLPKLADTDASGNAQSGDIEIDQAVLETLMKDLGTVYSPKNPPSLSTNPADCPSGSPGIPVAYCPDKNVLAVDLPGLQKLGQPADESNLVLLQGDNTAISALTSRYALAVQHERGLSLDTPVASLRTACLTGAAQKAMAATDTPTQLRLSAGDIDEAVAGLLVNGIVASNVNGETVPAGFTRIVAYRSGLEHNAELCYQRFA